MPEVLDQRLKVVGLILYPEIPERSYFFSDIILNIFQKQIL